MHVEFRCPACQALNRARVDATAAMEVPEGEPTAMPGGEPSAIACADCDWSREHRPFDGGRPAHCLVCGCDDLWRQKDFPQSVGLGLVALGATLSTIAWAWHEPLWAIGILLVFAAFDLLLFALVRDVLVCYRCRTRYRGVADTDDPIYDHELGERYRQESLRLAEKT